MGHILQERIHTAIYWCAVFLSTKYIPRLYLDISVLASEILKKEFVFDIIRHFVLSMV